jgi:hypothetical protein
MERKGAGGRRGGGGPKKKPVSQSDLWPDTERDPAEISGFSAEAHAQPNPTRDPAEKKKKKKKKSDAQELITSSEDLPVAHHRNLQKY